MTLFHSSQPPETDLDEQHARTYCLWGGGGGGSSRIHRASVTLGTLVLCFAKCPCPVCEVLLTC